MRFIGWQTILEDARALWHHSKNPEDGPYALLTRGDIGDAFCNMYRLVKTPERIAQAGGHLANHPVLIRALERTPGAVVRGKPRRLPRRRQRTTMSDAPFGYVEGTRHYNVRVICAANGAITLGHEVAKHLGCEFAFAIKHEKEPGKVEYSLELFEEDLRRNQPLLIVEETVNQGGTVLALRDLLRKLTPAPIVPCVATICCWTAERELDGLAIAALHRPRMDVWRLGDNPHTLDGAEIIPPLKPKSNWPVFMPPKDA